MPELDVEKFIAGLHGYLERELDPFAKRLKGIEERAAVPGPRGEKGEVGPDGKPGPQGPPALDGKHGEKGEKGDPGLGGKDGLPGAQGQPGTHGEKGEAGLEGKPGAQGQPGTHGEKGEAGLEGKSGSQGPPGPHGERGEAGLEGKPGPQGIKGDKGEEGKSVTLDQAKGIFESEVRRWELEFERRAHDLLHREIDKIQAPVNGKDGLPGRDGKDAVNGKDGLDGLGFDDLQVLQKDEKTILLRFSRGEKVKEFSLSFPVIIDRGVYKSDSIYAKGDGVTYGGSFWFCQKEKTSSKPGENDHWRLAVKRGRDARVEA